MTETAATSALSTPAGPDPVAVIGATGQQGRAVVEDLLLTGTSVRALVRDPTSSRARALAERGVQLVAADQEDADQMVTGLRGAGAVFAMTTFSGQDGVDGEVRRGRAIAEAAASAGVPRAVYSSVGGAERRSGVPHFESKFRVEQRFAELLPTQVVRPVFFMENLAQQVTDASGAGAEGGEVVVRLPLPPGVPLQLVAVADIGKVAARLLIDPGALADARTTSGSSSSINAVEIAGDELTGEQAARVIGHVLGRPARYEALPLEVLGQDEDLRAMFRWFAETSAYAADLDLTRALAPEVLDLKAWVRGLLTR